MSNANPTAAKFWKALRETTLPEWLCLVVVIASLWKMLHD